VRVELAGLNGSEVGAHEDEWRAWRADGWDVHVLVERRWRRGAWHEVALIALACRP